MIRHTGLISAMNNKTVARLLSLLNAIIYSMSNRNSEIHRRLLLLSFSDRFYISMYRPEIYYNILGCQISPFRFFPLYSMLYKKCYSDRI